ncbi:MAG TPA: tetratricopeptide repeat protein [Pyrinomonadaceae bacterium]|nr:tetratricopeptide repeat protein [Pyrinomonadaceae bacterium]
MSTQTPSSSNDQHGQKLESIRSLLSQSYELAQKEKYDDALPLAEQALVITRELSGAQDKALTSCFYQLAIVYAGKGERSRAEDLYKQSILFAENTADEGMLAAASQGLADLYYKEKANEKAKPLYEKALALWEKLGGQDYEGAIAARNRLSHIFLAQENFELAESLIRGAIVSGERILGPEHDDVARFLFTLSQILIKQRKYELAVQEIARLKRILQSSTSLEAQSHLEAAFGYLSTVCSDQGKFDLAIALVLQAIEQSERAGRSTYPDLAMRWLQLSKTHEAGGNYEKAEVAYKRTLSLTEQTHGPNHPYTACELNNLAGMYDRKLEYDKSEPIYLRSLKIFEQTEGSEQNLAYTAGQLGWLHLQKSEFDKAEPFFKRAVDVSEKALGEDSPIYAIHLNGLAALYQRTKDFSRAESLYNSSLAITEKVINSDHLESVSALMGLGEVSLARGEYQQAESFYRRALAIREKALGPQHPDVTFPLDSLGWLYVAEGEYGKAEPLFRRSLEIRQERFGAENIQVVPSLNNLANIYRSIGNYENARELYERALSINENTLGPRHRYVGFSLNSLGSLLLDGDEYVKAEPLVKRSLSIAEEVSGPEHPDVGVSLDLLGLTYRAIGNFDKAESYYKRALAIDEKAFGPEDTSVAVDLHHLALLYTAQGSFAKAEPLFERTLQIEERVKGSLHPSLAETLLSITYFYGAKGDVPRAIQALTRGTEISERTINSVLTSSTGTENQKNAYMAMDSIAFETKGAVTLHVQFARESEQAARLALTTLLRRKGRVLDAVSDTIQRLRQHINPKDGQLLDELTIARSRLAALALNGPGSVPPDQYEIELDKAQAEADRLEATISTRSAEFSAGIKPITLEEVQSAIPSDAVLIEIVSYQPFNPKYKMNSEMWGEAKYAAYALRHNGSLKWVDLGEAKTIDDLAREFRIALRDRKSTNTRELGRKLYEKLIGPASSLIAGASRVLLSPDSELNLIPFGALVDEHNQYLIERYSFTYLTSGRDLVRMGMEIPDRGTPILIGDAQYDAVFPASPSSQRDQLFVLSTVRFTRLPGTADEVRNIGGLLPAANVWTGEEASKTNLTKATAPAILHIATHGFFLPDQEQTPKLAPSMTRQLGLDGVYRNSRVERRLANPLLRSGLALAGANNRQGAPSDNGILTALEAAGLDLWGTKLVALSACETGVGDVKVGEGVYGLRRALVIAGAESQITTLWQVDDLATRDLMIDFYGRLQNGEGRSEALRNAQASMLKTTNRNHPYYWASFIQLGDWRPL